MAKQILYSNRANKGLKSKININDKWQLNFNRYIFFKSLSNANSRDARLEIAASV